MLLVILAIVISLFSAVIPIQGTDVWYTQFIALMLMGFCLVLCQLWRFSKPLSLLYGWFIYSTIFVAHQELMSVMCLLQVSFCLLFAQKIAGLKYRELRVIVLVLFLVLVVQTLWGFVQGLNKDPFFHLVGNTNLSDTVGFSGSHNQYGLSLAALSVTAWSIFPWLLPFVFAAVVLSKTFTAVLGFLAASVFMGRKAFKIDLILMGFMSIILAVGFLKVVPKGLEEKLAERGRLWSLTVSQVLKGKAVMQLGPQVKRIVTCNPMAGFGLGRFMAISPYTQDKAVYHKADGDINNFHFEHAHNDYIELFFDTGKIGLTLLLIVIINLLYLFFKATQNDILLVGAGGLIVYAVAATGIYTVHTATGGFFLSVFLGLFYAGVKHGTTGKK